MAVAPVYCVLVPGRLDGVHVFERPGDADAFAEAVGRDDCIVSEEPVNDADNARHLITAEVESWQ